MKEFFTRSTGGRATVRSDNKKIAASGAGHPGAAMRATDQGVRQKIPGPWAAPQQCGCRDSDRC